MAGREGLRDGTTAVVALVQVGSLISGHAYRALKPSVLVSGQEDRLTLAHVGDSRGVLCRGGTAVELTHDHKPVGPFQIRSSGTAAWVLRPESHACRNLKTKSAG